MEHNLWVKSIRWLEGGQNRQHNNFVNPTSFLLDFIISILTELNKLSS